MFSADLGGAPPAATPAATDPPFQKVALLLHGDGTNGAQNNTFVDYSYPGGYAVSFDGTGDYLTVPSNTAFDFGSGDFTIEMWIHPTSFSAEQLPLAKGYSSLYGFAAYLTSGTVKFLYNGANIISSSSTLSLNTWSHIAYVKSGSTLSIYVNGVSTGSGSVSSISFDSSYLSVGAKVGGSFAFAGYISNLRIVKGTALYTSTFVPSNLPLTAVSGTQLLTCQSATIVDNSPNAFTITANGDAAAVASKTITRTGNVAQGTFSPFSLAEGQWSNYFDGTGDYLNTSASSAFAFGTGDFTVEAWIYKTANATESTILSNLESGSDGNNALMIGVNSSNAVYTSTWLTRLSTSSTNVVSNNTWTHIVFCRSGTSAAVFVNGTRVSSFTLTNDFSRTTAYKVGAYIYSGSAAGVITGYISNARVVKGTAVYDPTASTITVPTSALTAVSGTSLLTCQSNRFKDNSSNNFTITRNGDTKVTAWSPFAPSAAYSAGTNGGSGYFDGSGDYLSTASSSAFAFSGDFTVECWTYPNTQTQSFPSIIWFDTSQQLAIQYNHSAAANKFSALIKGTRISPTATQSTDSWYHLALVRSGSTISLYINGVSVATTTDGSAFSNSLAAIGGYDPTSSGLAYKGYVSNVRIVSGTAVYTTNFTPPTAPLTAVSGTQLLLNCVNAGIYDNSGKNDIETVGNAQISTSVKKYGTGSMYFDGTGDWLQLPNSDVFNFGTGDVTLEAWVYPTSSVTQAIFSCFPTSGSSPTAYTWQITSSGYLQMDTWVGTEQYITATNNAIPLNTWTHVAYTRSSGTSRLFVNGVSCSFSGSITQAINSGGYTPKVGYTGYTGYLNPFNGYIDDLRITKGQALYTSNFTPPTQAFPNV